MKVFLYGKNSQDIEDLVKSLGFEVVESDPDVIISYGGDGTLLSSERAYPGIPKLPIRNSLVCKKCADHGEKLLLTSLLKGKLQLKEYQKLQTNINGKELLALNDFVIRNEEQIHAIRFKLLYSGSLPSELLIGDGIVVSTPFGSTGYFKSITGETFTDGFAVALNNVTEKNIKTIYADQDEYDKADGMDKMGFQLIRGKATLTYDNSEEIFHISEGTKLSFKLSDQVARIYEPDSLRCPNCQVIRGPKIVIASD